MSPISIVLKDIGPRMIVYLKCRGSWRQLPGLLGRLDQYVAQRQLSPTGAASAMYYNTPKEVGVQELIWEIFYPVNPEIAEASEDRDGFGTKEILSVTVAAAVHRGSFRRTGPTYAFLDQWISQRGLRICGPAEEVYISGFAGPAEQEIEIRFPVC